MPIFTFIGSSILHRDYEYSFKVAQKGDFYYGIQDKARWELVYKKTENPPDAPLNSATFGQVSDRNGPPAGDKPGLGTFKPINFRSSLIFPSSISSFVKIYNPC